MKTNKFRDNRPIIETIINTTALALTSFGVLRITQSPETTWNCLSQGMMIISFGGGLEFFKYWGRKKNLW